MHQKYLRLVTITALAMSSATASALPFSGFDPRSMAMGGVGVAVGSAETAPIFNPALLSAGDPKERFALAMPIGVRVTDQDKLFKSVDDFQKGNYVNDFNTKSNAYNLTPNVTNLNAVVNSMSTMSTQLNTMSNKTIGVDAGGALVIAVPRKNVGWAFYANAALASGGVFDYKDDAQIQAWKNATNGSTGIVTNCFNATTGAPVPPVFNAGTGTWGMGAACDAAITSNAAYYSIDNTTPGSPKVKQVFNPSTNLQSTVSFRGATLGELGLSLSHEFQLGGLAVGVTPKLVNAQLIDYQSNVNNSSTSTPNGADYIAKYNMFNLDLGVAKSYQNGWRTGFVIKNLVPYSLEFKNKDIPTGNKLDLKPQARVGGSFQGKWGTIALDADLTRNDPAGVGKASQFVAIGGELDIYKLLQLRVGYRADLANNDNSVASVGAGLNVFGLHTDLAVAGNQNQVGASIQLGLHF